jgi:hypothetical protein
MYKIPLRRVCAIIVAMEKAISITYSECVFVASVTQHSMRSAPYTYFHMWLFRLYQIFTLSQKWMIFEKKNVTEYKNCVLIFYKILSETFPVQISIRRNITINAHSPSRKALVILLVF